MDSGVVVEESYVLRTDRKIDLDKIVEGSDARTEVVAVDKRVEKRIVAIVEAHFDSFSKEVDQSIAGTSVEDVD